MTSTMLPSGDLLFDGTEPCYRKLQHWLRQAILSGKLGHGDALCPDRKLANVANVSRATVRKAVDDLVRDGLLIRRKGSGTFVSSPMPRLKEAPRLGLAQLTAGVSGLDPQVAWFERRLANPSPTETTALGISTDVLVARHGFLRLERQKPVSVEHTCVPAEFLPNPLCNTSSLYTALEVAGVQAVRTVVRIFARSMGKSDATMLGVPVGSAGLSTERISYLLSGRAVEFTRSVHRGDFACLTLEITTPES